MAHPATSPVLQYNREEIPVCGVIYDIIFILSLGLLRQLRKALHAATVPWRSGWLLSGSHCCGCCLVAVQTVQCACPLSQCPVTLLHVRPYRSQTRVQCLMASATVERESAFEGNEHTYFFHLKAFWQFVFNLQTNHAFNLLLSHQARCLPSWLFPCQA